jgi:hypothetical protein
MDKLMGKKSKFKVEDRVERLTELSVSTMDSDSDFVSTRVSVLR